MLSNETYYPNSIRDNYKQDNLEILHNGLKDFLVEGRENAFTVDLCGVNSNEIGDYLKKLIYDQDLDIQLGNILDASIENKDDFIEICDNLGITGIGYKGDEKVYFIESGDSFLAVIPIDTGNQTATVKIEHWDNSEGTIKNLGRKAIVPTKLNPDDFVTLV